MKRLLLVVIAVCFVVMIGCDENGENFDIEKPSPEGNLTPFLNHYTIEFDGTDCNEDWSAETWEVIFTDDADLDGKDADGKGTYYYLGDGSSPFVKEKIDESTSNADVISSLENQIIIETVQTNLKENEIYHDRIMIMNFENESISGELWFTPDKECRILLEGICNNCDEKHNQVGE